jgi:hypothetical protein
MISRDDLKCRIDRVPEDRLEAVRDMLNFQINPPYAQSRNTADARTDT